ncbi:hypothetical protein ACTQ45_09590 [Fundicoccus sp. Sow4_D5]|uniref:hypothetical protein n=1 Tax=Fundicoccus sp. Sow4_D5 TaxID=3438782 RepID=UPI003F90C9B7
MTEYDGPAFNQKKESHSLKNRRFNQLSQRESSKTYFEPAMKERRKVFPTISDMPKASNRSDHPLLPTQQAKEASDHEAIASQMGVREKRPEYEGQGQSSQQQTQRSTFEQANRATPQADYEIPFLKNHEKQIKKLNQASLENAMNERQTQPMSKPVQPNRPARTLAETYPQLTKTLKENQQETIETSVKTSTTYDTSVKEKPSSKTVFQPTELPKPYKGHERRKEDVEEIRELAKRLVKTRETFLLFEH